MSVRLSFSCLASRSSKSLAAPRYAHDLGAQLLGQLDLATIVLTRK